MAFPEDSLAPHERLILHLRPHWWFIFKSGFMLVVTIVLGAWVAFAVGNDVVKYLVAAGIVVALVWFLVRFVQWISTHFVLTTDRVIHREGVIGHRGIEIPLERINTVFYQQRVFERLLGLGDLEIESASKDGAQVFDDIRRPSEVQKEIYIQIEANENRRIDRLGSAAAAGAGAGAAQAAGVASGPPSIADQIGQLAQLRDSGHITPEEFEAKKAELLGRM